MRDFKHILWRAQPFQEMFLENNLEQLFGLFEDQINVSSIIKILETVLK